jgi:hypothetical protein
MPIPTHHGPVPVTVRDGRAGLDAARVTAEGGEILDSYEVSEDPRTWPKQGDVIQLPTGDQARVAFVNESIAPDGFSLTVIAGDIFDE